MSYDTFYQQSEKPPMREEDRYADHNRNNSGDRSYGNVSSEDRQNNHGASNQNQGMGQGSDNVSHSSGYQRPNESSGSSADYQSKQDGQERQSSQYQGQKQQHYQNNGNRDFRRDNGNGYRNGNGGGNSGNSNFNRNNGGFNRSGGFKPKPVDENATLYLPYVGTGNDNPPQTVVDQIHQITRELESLGYTMRTGGMAGTESIFENATKVNEIHLPWKGFDNKDSKHSYTAPEAKIIAAKYQPGYDGLKPVIQTFLAKNVRMLMGQNLKSPALFMVTWTDDGCEHVRTRTSKTGNAGHAIAIASHLMIPVFNLGNPTGFQRLMDYISKAKEKSQEQPQSSPGRY